jgi:hypothetical protein
MRYQNPAKRCRDRENVRIVHAFRNTALRQFEVDLTFAAENACDDILV